MDRILTRPSGEMERCVTGAMSVFDMLPRSVSIDFTLKEEPAPSGDPSSLIISSLLADMAKYRPYGIVVLFVGPRLMTVTRTSKCTD